MKNIFLAAMAIFIFSTSAFSASELDGKKIVEKVLKSGRADIIIMGEATKDPRLSLILKNEADWKKLNKDRKESVCLYIKSMVPDVQRNPQKYTRMPSSAPFYPRAIKNIENMCLDCWEISSEYDSFVIGDEAWERMEYKQGNIKFSSVFEKQKSDSTDTRTNKTISKADLLEKRVQMVSEKIKSEPYYGNFLAEIRVSDDDLTIYTKQDWESISQNDREEVIKQIYTFWLSTGKLVGIEERPDEYKIEIRSSLLGRVLATWDAKHGFKEK